MGNQLDHWQIERERLLGAIGTAIRPRVTNAIDRAAATAQQKRLRDAASSLEEARLGIVNANLFRSWDDGISCFSNLIQIIRSMSPERAVPSEYQRLLDAVPRDSGDTLTRAQRAFWYGSPPARTKSRGVKLFQQIPLVAWLAILLAVIAGVAFAVF